jgi:peptidoglycan/LPS O-acetylase OafA/YrhL
MQRLKEFDAIRGIAAMVIVLAHIGHAIDSPWVTRSVDLFFVLSGYFITTNILKSAGSPGFLRLFFLRRTLRIWPAYFLALGACLIIGPRLRWDQPNVAWPYYCTFTQNVPYYWGGTMPPFSGMFKHTWTLAIEEQFYLLWPLLAVIAGRKRLIPLAALFMAIPLAMRSLGFDPYLLLTRCDGLALGALLAVLVYDRERLQRRMPAFRTAFALTGLAAVSAPVWCGLLLAPMERAWPAALRPNLLQSATTFRCCVAFFALAGLVFCCEGHRWLALLRDRRLCHVGKISYGLYLYHPLVFAAMPALYHRFVMRKLGLRSSLLMDVAMIAVCFALAELSRRFVEQPFLALKQRFAYEPTGAGRPHVRVDQASQPASLHRPQEIPDAKTTQLR